MTRYSAVFRILALLATPLLDAQRSQAARLIVDNRTQEPARIEVWRYNGKYWEWSYVADALPRRWIPIYPVNDGDRYRATLRKGIQYHTVQLVYDRNYGGMQSVWWLR